MIRAGSRWRRRCRGQATAEMVVGCVGLAAVFMGLIQVFQLGDANVQTHLDARGSAETSVVNNPGAGGQTTYVSDWGDGDDALRHTADDTRERLSGDQDSTAEFTAQLVATDGFGNSLRLNTPPLANDDFSPDTGSLTAAASLQSATRSRRVPVEAACRLLLGIDETRLRVDDTVYMPDLRLTPMGPGQ